MKIALCSPVHSTVTMEYAYSLATMIQWTNQVEIIFNDQPVRPEIKVFMERSSILPQIRNRLVKAASDWGADYLLWIDADMSFPQDSLLRLLSLNLPVVGVNYIRRGPSGRPTSTGLDGQDVVTTNQRAESGEVEQVSHLGLGFCLIAMDVIHRLASERANGRPLPFFDIEMIDDGTNFRGEDFYFFKRVRDAGYAVHLDHLLSWSIGHIAQKTLRHS